MKFGRGQESQPCTLQQEPSTGLSASTFLRSYRACFHLRFGNVGIVWGSGNGEPAVEVPLDGTVYDLDTGRVLEWCPKNNPIRMLLGSLKVSSFAMDPS